MAGVFSAPYLEELGQDLIARCRSLLRSHGTVILTTGIASVVALKALKLLFKKRVDFHARFGGPTAFLPFLGFVPRSLDHLFRALEIYADTYGGLYAIRATGKDIVVVSNADLIREMLKDRPRAYMRSFNVDNIMPIKGLFSVEGEEWRLHRRLVAPAFNEKNTDAMISDISRVAMKLVRHVDALAGSNGRIVWSPREWISRCTLDVICVATFGQDFDFVDPEGIRLGCRTREILQAVVDSTQGLGYAAQLGAFPWLTRDRFPWTLNPMINKLHRGVEYLQNVCDTILSKRLADRESGERTENRDLLDKMLHLDPVDLSGHLMTFLVAGSDTTAMVISWCLYYFCRHPGIQRRARKEVDALGHDLKTIVDFDKLPYVQACIYETLRIQPSAVFIFHETLTEVTLDGKVIPPGTMVGTLLRKAMIGESDGGTTFKPERWLVPDGSAVDPERARNHLAFGAPTRQCIGQSLAIKEATTICALLLRHFDGIKLHPNGIDRVLGDNSFTYGPKNLEVEMRQRNL